MTVRFSWTTILLRISQEAIHNALRHARSEHIVVDLIFEPTQVRLWIQDDGEGFDLHYQDAGEGFGLRGMRQRAERIGAKIQIRSQLGLGTEVAVIVPVSPLESVGVGI